MVINSNLSPNENDAIPLNDKIPVINTKKKAPIFMQQCITKGQSL